MYPDQLQPPSNSHAQRTQHGLEKTTGATYTPAQFADFVAMQMLQAFPYPNQPLRLLDPAVGDGQLLISLITQIPEDARHNIVVVGFDTDATAIALARQRLQQAFPAIHAQLEVKNFLDYVLPYTENNTGNDILSVPPARPQFDLIIANPPYVRTQTMGAQQAQLLAKKFGLRGRVDLYYPFLLGISAVLAADGIAGMICSNRFMTTKAGQDVRRELLTRFAILQVWDMGDTRLFDAAVLPAVLLARGIGPARQPQPGQIVCSTIYSSKEPAGTHAADVFAALKLANNQIAELADGRRFQIRHGRLENDGDEHGVWRLANGGSDDWLATVARHTWDSFARIGKIRVGVKSTADKVFIRSDWDSLETGTPELLRPLITRYCARRFKAALPAKASQQKRILYPHEITPNGRAAVDLQLYPKTRRYLEQHRPQLEQRDYLIKAKRNWYELWVPQDPAAWQHPKLVFRDISEKPEFWIDTDGGIVNGECYWLRCDNDADEDLLWLALAVANSQFIEAFYDKCFNNKLYAGRRRFMAQYVQQFPLPDPRLAMTQQMIAMAKAIHAATPSPQAAQMAQELDAMVWRVFGSTRCVPPAQNCPLLPRC